MTQSLPPSGAARSPHALYLSGLSLAAVGAICFSAKAIVAKLMYREGLDAVSVIALRMLVAVPFFLAMAWWSMRSASNPPRLARTDWLKLAGLGLVGYYASSMLDFLGLQYISAGLERLILFLTPSIVLLMSVALLKRRVTSREWISLAVAYSGIVLVFWHDVHLGGRLVWLGAGLVFASAVTYAVYLLGSGELVKRLGSLRLVALAMIVASLACIAQYALLRPFGGLFVQTPTVWVLALVNGTLCTVVPVLMTMMAVERIGAGNAAQAGMIGPVSTLFLGFWLLSEPITLLQLAGTALVLAGMFILSLKKPLQGDS
ncbi:multidrug DMT transporter permease [beta proteobacterium AAP99]|nr:multidrug DMT transporter permease [beta proteobacterium AAP99]